MTLDSSGADYLASGAIRAPTGHQIDVKEPNKIDDFEAFLGTLGALQRTYVIVDSALASYSITR